MDSSLALAAHGQLVHHRQRALEVVEARGPEVGVWPREVEQPRMPQVDGSALVRQGEQIAHPAPGAEPPVVELPVDLVDHELHQLVPGGHVAVQRRRPGPDGCSHRTHRHPGEPGPVSQPYCCCGDSCTAVLGAETPA